MDLSVDSVPQETACTSATAATLQSQANVIQTTEDISTPRADSRNCEHDQPLNLSQPTGHKKLKSPDNDVRFELVPGIRNGSEILYVCDEKQIYHKNVRVKDGFAYVCFVKGCYKRVHVNHAKKRCRRKAFNVHNHSSHEQDYLNIRILNEIKQNLQAPAKTVGTNMARVRSVFNTAMRK